MSLSSCLLFKSIKQHLDMYTYKVVKQQRRRQLATFDIAIDNRYKDRRYLLGYLHMFQLRVKYFMFMLVLLLFNRDNESVSSNTKLNLITWWICFSFKKVDWRSAIIHVLPNFAHSRVTKGRAVDAKWTAIYFVQSSTDECKYCTNIILVN